MQFSRNFSCLALFVLALASGGKATPLAPTDGKESATIGADKSATHIASYEQMLHRSANDDAKLTLIGTPINPLASRDGAAAQNTVVTVCGGELDGGYCTGLCIASFSLPAQCFEPPIAVCSVSATSDVELCTKTGCKGTCSRLSDCKTLLLNGSCYAPGTQSILVLE